MEPPASPAAVPPSGSLLRKLIPQRRERAEAAPLALPGETWQRVALGPDVELHVREPTPPDRRERIERLIAFARALFQNGQDG
jgi:hypothetical protein